LLGETYSNGRRSFSNARAQSSQPQTDDRGGFRFSGVLPGEYYIRIENSEAQHLPRLVYYPSATDSALAATVAIRGVDLSLDIRLPSQPAYKISGSVVSPVPIRAGGYSLASANPDTTDDPFSPIAVDPSSPTEFRFEITGIPPGRYFFYPIIRTDKGYATNQTILDVGNEDLKNLRITMRPGVDLKGKITLAGDANAMRLESIRIATRGRGRLPQLIARDIVGVTTSPTGEFVLPGLTPDVPFDLRLMGLPLDTYVSDIRHGERSVYNDGFIRPSSSDDSMEIHVDTRGGTITGLVRDSANQAVKQATVVIVPDITRRANPLAYKRATTDANGEFTLRGIAPGEYQLFAWSVAPPQGAEENARFLAPYEGKGTIVRITRGEKTNVQLRLAAQ
jgi:hypothetical protein